MEEQIDSLVIDIQKLLPSTNENELKALVYLMSERSGISTDKLLRSLLEELKNGIPFRYTSVGKSRSWILV